MNIKKFTANSAQEAVQSVKREMGPEAVILRTRTLSSRGLKGQRVEVTAAVDYEAVERLCPQQMAIGRLVRQALKEFCA